MKKATFTITWDNFTYREHFEQVYYWYDRFKWSRDVDHLDKAERHADVVRDYLPQ